MTLQEFIDYADKFKPSLKSKQIFIKCENGLLATPKIKRLVNDEFETQDIIITWE
jgi:hypothetical protein